MNLSSSTPKVCFKVVNLADLHLGHRHLRSDAFIEKVVKYVFPVLTDEVDILFIPGDFFDGLYTMNHRIGRMAIRLMKQFIHLAVQHDFVIRVVRGTYIHDHDQNRFWLEEVPESHPEVVKIFETISIESVKGLDVLYIPDNAPKDTLSVIKRLMKDRGLTFVDFVIGHGYFEHELPYGKVVHELVFKVSDFEKIAGVVVFGHVHEFNVYKNFISPGSFDRSRHGEEKRKGFVVVDYNKETKKMNYTFIVNHDSLIFKTFNLTQFDNQEELINKYTQLIEDLLPKSKENINVSITIDNSLFRNVLVDTNKRYPRVILTFKKSKEVELTRSNTSTIRALNIITKDNISKMIFDYIKGQLSVDRIETILKSLGPHKVED